jgi:hypothetical protein
MLREAGKSFPLTPRDKVPLKGSRGFKDATTHQEQIRAWWTKHPEANIGIRTGAVSDLVVIDVDAKPGKHGAATLDALEEEFGALPQTATVLSSGHGRHYYFTYARVAVSGVDALGLNIDMQSDGRYIVAPPSVHPDGTVYEWADEATLATLPEWVVRFAPLVKPATRFPRSYVPRRSTTPWDLVTPMDNFRGEQADKACAHALGLPHPGKFSCILPGHGPDASPSASLFLGRGGDLLYQCFHRGDVTLTLPQVRASLAYGQVTLFKDDHGRGQAGEHVAWRLRLLYEAGALDPNRINYTTLSPDAGPAIKAVYEGFILLLGLKEHLWPGQGATFSWRFARAWCGVTERQAKDAIVWLMKNNYLWKTGVSRGRFGKEVGILSPGLLIDLEQMEWA